VIQNTNLKEVAKMIANESKKTLGQRTVVITCGADPVLVVKALDNKVMECNVPKIPDDEIVDTNAAGDAFAGGFLSQWIMDKPLATCIKCAFYCAHSCLKTVGCSSPKHACQFVE
jgi:adenosine kinase